MGQKSEISLCLGEAGSEPETSQSGKRKKKPASHALGEQCEFSICSYSDRPQMAGPRVLRVDGPLDEHLGAERPEPVTECRCRKGQDRTWGDSSTGVTAARLSRWRCTMATNGGGNEMRQPRQRKTRKFLPHPPQINSLCLSVSYSLKENQSKTYPYLAHVLRKQCKLAITGGGE